MVQQFIIENKIQQTVNFSVVSNGDLFIYNNNVCLKLDNNNPNYAVLDTGLIGKLADTTQTILPNVILIKLE